MSHRLKKLLYFPVAFYFRFFAGIRLRRWKPRIIVITGSNGKTTVFHLLEAQFGKKARYSHHANSSFGVPFNILGLERKTLLKTEWFRLFFAVPFRAFAPVPKEAIYIVECDCDRPGEGKFLGEFLCPEVVLWVSSTRTHAMFFDALVRQKKFTTVEEAVAYEFGYFLEYCSKLVVVDGDSDLAMKQTKRTRVTVKAFQKSQLLEKYSVGKEGTIFIINGIRYSFSALLPEEVATGIAMCKEAVAYFGLPFDTSFAHFTLPPGRGSLFAGIKNTILIDSTYNANLQSITVSIQMFMDFPAQKKWVVISDMLELGEEEKEEHEKLAEILRRGKFEKIILLGQRTALYTYKKLGSSQNVVSFLSLLEVKNYLDEHINGKEAILFKGSQSMYLEALLALLLKNKSDESKLPRRGSFWDDQRKRALC